MVIFNNLLIIKEPRMFGATSYVAEFRSFPFFSATKISGSAEAQSAKAETEQKTDPSDSEGNILPVSYLAYLCEHNEF